MQPSEPDPAYADQAPAYGPPPQMYPPPYVAPPYWQGHPYTPTAPSPSVATAIITAVLSILLSLYQGSMAVLYFAMASLTSAVLYDLDADEMGWLTSFVVIMGVGSALGAIALLVGPILLVARKLFARWIIGFGCTVTVVMLLIPVILAELLLGALSSEMEELSLFSFTDNPFVAFLVTISFVVPVVATVLAFLPSTRRYCVR